jgi:uncharacterized protein YjbI with pentapeptide repeats
MGKIVELPSLKPRSTRRRQGLRKLSPDLISKARDETATQVTRVGLTFLGTAAFCLLSLLSPDSALLGGNDKINVPLAGPVSFSGFMLLGPAVLIVLRIYLQIYVDHGDRLDRLAQRIPLVRAPTLVPLKNPLIKIFNALLFYLLLPMAIVFFAWKAAVFPAWGSGLLCVATGVVVSHVMLPFSRLSWRLKGLLSLSAAIIVAGVVFVGFPLFGLELPRRPFDLYHANLSGQWLARDDLRNADLRYANLRDAHLPYANLSGANLSVADLGGANGGANLSGAVLGGAILRHANLRDANLSGAILVAANLVAAYLRDANLVAANLVAANLNGADLSGANLSYARLSDANLSGAVLGGANLKSANLSGANLSYARLSDANLSGAVLSEAKNLIQKQLNEACGNADTKLPEGLAVKPCSTN